MTGTVIIGAGQAGAAVAENLRKLGYEGRLTLVGAEKFPPYERPPLSKSYLLGEVTKERLFLRPKSVFAENEIELKLGTPVTKVDTTTRSVRFGDAELPYEHLVFATGSDPVKLPAAIGGSLEGVHTVRTLLDIDEMSPRFVAGARVLIIGGGYVGLEAAAVAAKLGLNVTLVEMAPRILNRVACAQTADIIRAEHSRHGVDIREGVGLERLIGDDRITAAALTDGSCLDIDFAVVGIGIRPSDSLAQLSGLAIDNGISVDRCGQTSVPNIWAAGDCASFPYKGARIRLESVQNAIDQAEAVARNILGQKTTYLPYPWFWSDQYDLKLQIAGLNTGYDQIASRESGAGLSHWYFRNGDFLAVDAINAPRDYMVGKRLLESGRSISPSEAANPAIDLKTLLRS